MKCAFDYCLYNQNMECYFDEISINATGMCEECTNTNLRLILHRRSRNAERFNGVLGDRL